MSEFCTEVGPDCPLSGSVYGYYPNRGENLFYAAYFGIAVIVNLFYGIKYKQYSFMVAMVIGCILESVGNGTRIMLTDNPYSSGGLKIQLVCLTIAPAFLAAGIYLCLKHLVIAFGSRLSRIPAAWYTYIFITCDLLSLVLQGIGGGVAAGADDNDQKTLDTGNNIMIAGLAFQVLTLAIFGVLALEFAWRVWSDVKQTGGAGINPETAVMRHTFKFKAFVIGIAVAYTTMMIRCIYRVVEMAGGWGSKLMQDEILFIILDPTMIAIMVTVFMITHPGMFFYGLREETIQAHDVEKATSSPSSSRA